MSGDFEIVLLQFTHNTKSSSSSITNDLPDSKWWKFMAISRFKMMKIHGYFQDCLSPPLSFVFWMKITFHIPPQIFRIACFPAPFLLLLSFLAYFDFWFRRFPRLLTPKSRPHWNLWVRLQNQHNECCHPFGKINFDTISFSKRYVCWQHWHISCCDPLMVKFC